MSSIEAQAPGPMSLTSSWHKYLVATPSAPGAPGQREWRQVLAVLLSLDFGTPVGVKTPAVAQVASPSSSSSRAQHSPCSTSARWLFTCQASGDCWSKGGASAMTLILSKGPLSCLGSSLSHWLTAGRLLVAVPASRRPRQAGRLRGWS